MINEHFERIVKEKFGFDFSPTQQEAMKNFLAFLFDRHPESLFLLKGYAGTGKTSLVAAIVNTLLQFEQQVVLLAPTGRAAKVFSGYSHQPAFTIHKKIYRQKNAQLQIPKSGLFDSKRFRYFLKRHLRAKTFEELKIPMIVVATDLDNGESHEFKSGPIVDAVTASCSIPIIFSPVVINGVHYVDGGLFHNFPVSIIRDMCERVIGVNVSPLVPQKYKQTIFHIAERSYHYMFRANTLEDREMCDVLIEAEEFGMYKTFDLENVDEIAGIGYAAAIRAFEVVIKENKYETLVNAIMARRNNALMP